MIPINTSWKNKKFEEIVSNIKEVVDPSKNKKEIYIGLEHIEENTGKLLSKGKSTDTTSLKNKFQRGHILFGKLRPYLKKFFFANVDGYCSTEILVFQAKSELVINQYVFYLCQTDDFISYCISGSEGTKMPRVSWKNIKNFSCYIPPLPEQKKIAAILSSVDRVIETTQDAIAQLQIVKRGLMQQLLTKGIPGWHKEYKDTKLGDIPTNWNIISLGKCLQNTPQNGLYKPESSYGKGYFIVRIDRFQDGDILQEQKFQRIDLEKEELKVFALNEKDLVINRVNSISHLGKTAIVGHLKESTVFESNMMRLSCNKDILSPQYAIKMLCSKEVRRQLLSKAKKAVAQASINQQDVQSLLVKLPPLPEQSKIADILTSIDKRIEAEEAKKAQVEIIKKGLMQQLLTGKIRVKIDAEVGK